jgi:activator of HSP90 ATPase
LERLVYNWDASQVNIKEEKDKQDLIKTKQNTKPVNAAAGNDKSSTSSVATTENKSSVPLSSGNQPSAPLSSGNKSLGNKIDSGEQSSDTHTYAEKKVNAIDDVLLGLQAEDPKIHPLSK